MYLRAGWSKLHHASYMTTSVLKRFAGFFRKEAFTEYRHKKAQKAHKKNE